MTTFPANTLDDYHQNSDGDQEREAEAGNKEKLEDLIAYDHLALTFASETRAHHRVEQRCLPLAIGVPALNGDRYDDTEQQADTSDND